MMILSFNPKQVTKSLLADIKQRNKNVVVQRFGIGTSAKKKTLEAIGQEYGITRERVRQIENFALNSIKQSDKFAEAKDALNELSGAIRKRGGIVAEKDILDYLADDQQTKNHIHFLLVLGDDFTKAKEDDEFHHRWTIDNERADLVHKALRRLHKEVHKVEELIPENEIVAKLKAYTEELLEEKIKEESIRLWLAMSKRIDKNTFGEWGSVSSASVRPRGMRDLAFLVLRKQGSPMHFGEVAKTISEFFPKNAHPATVHNELIKDDRFVLVGRGLYALGEWGYSTGTVSDVIKNILKEAGPLSKEEIAKRVLKERYVKENTILVNLQNRKNFKRNTDGKYTIA